PSVRRSWDESSSRHGSGAVERPGHDRGELVGGALPVDVRDDVVEPRLELELLACGLDALADLARALGRLLTAPGTRSATRRAPSVSSSSSGALPAPRSRSISAWSVP